LEERTPDNFAFANLGDEISATFRLVEPASGKQEVRVSPHVEQSIDDDE
jgi:hypothetical protein